MLLNYHVRWGWGFGLVQPRRLSSVWSSQRRWNHTSQRCTVNYQKIGWSQRNSQVAQRDCRLLGDTEHSTKKGLEQPFLTVRSILLRAGIGSSEVPSVLNYLVWYWESVGVFRRVCAITRRIPGVRDRCCLPAIFRNPVNELAFEVSPPLHTVIALHNLQHF